MAAVCWGAAAPVLAGADEAGVDAAAPTDLLGDGTPDVNGAFEADEAPENAGEPAVAEGLAIVVFDGLRTWSIT